MTMPIDLVLVRHGESEGNLANKLSRQGDQSAFTEEFKKRHTSLWRLTSKGRWQASQAGLWINENIGGVFDRHYVSEYARALETAALLGLPDAHWRKEFYLRERDWGQLDNMSHEERQQRFGDELLRRERDKFYWAPAGGESTATVCLREERVFHTLHRECSDKRVIIVCHGGIILAFRIRLERMTQDLYFLLELSRNPFDQVQNCQIIHYTRRDPDTGQLTPHLNWVRSVCPWDMSLSYNEWETIVRKKYSNEDLLAEVEKIPRMVDCDFFPPALVSPA